MGCGIGRFGKYEAKNPTMDLYHPQTIRNPGLKDVKMERQLRLSRQDDRSASEYAGLQIFSKDCSFGK